MEFNSLMFIVLFIINIVLCIKRVPIIGFAVGFFSILLCGAVFLQDTVTINSYFSIVLMGIAFSCIIINGMDIIKKPIRKK